MLAVDVFFAFRQLGAPNGFESAVLCPSATLPLAGSLPRALRVVVAVLHRFGSVTNHGFGARVAQDGEKIDTQKVHRFGTGRIRFKTPISIGTI